MRQATVLTEGLKFGEGPRWHDGTLWLSDFRRRQVLTVDLVGNIEPVVDFPGQPSGLGWLPDGRLLIVSMLDQKLLRLDPDGLVEHADLSGIAVGHCNDMVVDGIGRAFVGNFGFDPASYSGYRLIGDAMRDDPNIFMVDPDLPTATLVRVDPDGSVFPAAEGLRFPNGSVVTADGSTLIVAESFGPCLTAFDIGPDGTLSNRRVWAQFPQRFPTIMPDGICLDAEGAIWVARPIVTEGDEYGASCLRITEGGEVLDQVATNAPCVACALGGPDRKTLFLVTSIPGEDFRAQVETVRVDVPGAGYP